MKGRKKVLIVLVATAALIVGLFWVFAMEREREQQGAYHTRISHDIRVQDGNA